MRCSSPRTHGSVHLSQTGTGAAAARKPADLSSSTTVGDIDEEPWPGLIAAAVHVLVDLSGSITPQLRMTMRMLGAVGLAGGVAAILPLPIPGTSVLWERLAGARLPLVAARIRGHAAEHDGRSRARHLDERLHAAHSAQRFG